MSMAYKCNNLFFSIPNITNCYWAGLLAADGNIVKGGKRFKISVSDFELLENFKNILNYEGNIHIDKKGDIKNKTIFRIEITNKIIVDDLRYHWNLVPKKSLILEPPNIYDINQQLAYIIGYIDGDGCISRKGNFQFTITGTKKLLEWMTEILYSLEDQNRYKKKLSIYNGSGNCFVIHSHRNRARKLVEKLTKFPLDYRLKRKWEE